jgi:hypothetical protein
MIGKLLVHQLLTHAYMLILFLPTETVNNETTTRNNCANKNKQTTTFNSLEITDGLSSSGACTQIIFLSSTKQYVITTTRTVADVLCDNVLLHNCLVNQCVVKSILFRLAHMVHANRTTTTLLG